MSGTLTLPLACFVGLAIGGAEVTVAGYTRQPTTLAYCEDGVTIANTASLQWSRAMASWGTIDTVLLYDMTGAQIASLPALSPIQIRMYDIARIPASGIVVVAIPVARAFGTGRFGTSVYGANSGYGPVITPGVFGAQGLGGADGTPGAFSARGYDIPVRGVMAMGTFGPAGYGTTGGVPLQRAFDNQHACEPGTWAPGPFAAAA